MPFRLYLFLETSAAPDGPAVRGGEMHDETAGVKPVDGAPEAGRRRFGVGLLAAVGGGLLARKVEAFPAAAGGHFNSATQILSHYGVSVGGSFDAELGHDLLKVTALPQAGTQYDLVFAELTSDGGLDPCYLTSSFDGTITSVHFAPGGIIPCIRVTVAGPLMTYELIDPHEGDIIPCIRVAAEHTADGGLGAIVASVDPDEDFRIAVGTRTYRLIEGQLVEDTAPH
jgi:hypothetical protein